MSEKQTGNGMHEESKPRVVRRVVKKRATRGPNATGTPTSLGKVAVQQKQTPQQRPGLFLYTLYFLYKNLYYLGIIILRRRLRIMRSIRYFLAILRGRAYAATERVTGAVVTFTRNFIVRLKTPFLRIASVYEDMRPRIAQSYGRFPLAEWLVILREVGRFAWTVLATVLNHAAPVAAAILLASVVRLYIRQPLALAVEYNGEVIGYVQDESEFERAAQTLQDRFIETSTSTAVIAIPHLRLVGVTTDETEPQGLLSRFMQLPVVSEDYTDTAELADRMVQSSGSEIEFAYGFYVDNQFYGAVTDSDTIINELNRIREENSTGISGERVAFIKKIGLQPGLYPVDSLVDSGQIREEVINAYETIGQTYIVEPEDTPSGIAAKNGVPYSLLLEMNPGIEESLMPGQEVRLSVDRPFLSVKNIYTSVYDEDFAYDTVEIETEVYAQGYREIAQEGQPGVREVTAEITTVNGIETQRVELASRIIRQPVDERVVVGTNKPAPAVPSDPEAPPATASGGGFMWPTSGGSISVGVGGYPGHTGIDIPRPAGTPIYASAAGTVVKVEYSYVNYGHHVIIDHGNGYQTLYAHASSLNVSVGQQVSQGQVIGAVGRTGRATGNHVHFEVKLNGRVMIPQNYVGG